MIKSCCICAVLFCLAIRVIAQPAAPATKPVLELKLRSQLKGHTFTIKSVTCAGDGRTIASGDASGLVILWDRIRGKEIRQLTGPADASVITLSFSRDGNRLATAYSDGHLRLWETDSGEMVREMQITALTAARFSPDGSVLVCTRGMIPESDDDREHVQILDPQSGKRTGAIAVDLEFVTDFSFAPDSRIIAISGGESLTDVPADKGGKQRNRIELWELSPNPTTQPANADESAKEKSRIGESGRPLLCPFYSAGGRLIAAASGDWLVWETKSGKQVATLRAPRYQARSVAISPNTRWVATGAIDSTVALFETREWEMRYQNQADPSLDVTSMCFTPEGSTLIAARGTTVELFLVPGR
ncbi:MAG: hypothetical protein H7Z14_06125 [Anaerolineae bacterium]|nr:hypothetical protein [Phycisphaerae bacterium]